MLRELQLEQSEIILSLPVVFLSLYAQHNPHSRIHSTDKTPFETNEQI